MNKTPLIINDLFINKMPGFRKGLKAYENLSPGINLIYGPNASGKSSTARMIKNIIWPENTIGYDANAHIKTGDDQWHISIDASRILRERNGQPASFGGIPAADTRNRYMLSLHELIMADDKDMAEFILRESSGGYDLDAAADELEYKETIPAKSKNEYKAYNEAEENYKKALESQKTLSKEEDRLEQLETQKQEAEKADKLKRLYEIRLDYLQKQHALGEAKSRLENFPVAFEKLSGNEADRLESLRKETHDLEAGLRDDEKTIRQTEDELTKLELPENGVDDKVLEELRIHSRNLELLEKKRKQLQEELGKAEVRAEKALHAIDPDADVSRWNEISIESVNYLQQFLTNAYNRLYQVNRLKQDIAQIDKEISQKPDKEVDDIKHAIKTLSDWMKSESKQAEAGQALKLTLMVAVLTALAVFGLTFKSHLAAGIALIIGIIGLVWLVFFRISKKSQNTNTHTWDQSMQLSPLSGPESWTPDAVSERLDDLFSELAEAKHSEQLHYRKKDLENDLNLAEDKLKTVREQYDTLKKNIEVMPQWNDEQKDNYAGLSWFITNLQVWQDAHLTSSEAKQQLENNDTDIKNSLAKINAHLKNYGLSPVNDSTETTAAVKNLEDKEHNRREVYNKQQHARENVKDKQDRVDKVIKEEAAIYQKLELEHGELQRVKTMLEQLNDYKQAVEEVRHGKRSQDEAFRILENHPLWIETQKEIEHLSGDELENEIRSLEEKAGRFEALVKEISGIQERVRTVQEGTVLEEALAKRDAAIENLQALYEKSLTDNTGAMLVQHLKEETREHNYPPVFKKASMRFEKITGGRYSLKMQSGDEENFMAFDNQNQNFLSLDKLSTGTRIQLLLSVRLAFIEMQESDYKLPLLADELLANSDDVRAEAVIQALLEIAREGRQVFYFTAQRDEVFKWQAHLNQSDVQHQLVTISAADNITEPLSPESRVEVLSLTHENLPEPEGDSHAAYAKKIEPPAFNPMTEHPSEIHLWYVIEDTNLLYKCLSRNISSLGALLRFLEAGGDIGAGKELLQNLEEKYRLLQRFVDMYRQGRSKPVDRQVLEESGAVSSSFIDDVSGLLSSVNYDPQKLINELRNSGVKGFRSTKTDELETYLIENQYISQDEPLTRDTINAQLQATLSGMNINRETADRMLQRILNSDAG